MLLGIPEQITQCPPLAQFKPEPPAMLGPVVQQMAPLAECFDIAVRQPQWAGS